MTLKPSKSSVSQEEVSKSSVQIGLQLYRISWKATRRMSEEGGYRKIYMLQPQSYTGRLLILCARLFREVVVLLAPT